MASGNLHAMMDDVPVVIDLFSGAGWLLQLLQCRNLEPCVPHRQQAVDLHDKLASIRVCMGGLPVGSLRTGLNRHSIPRCGDSFSDDLIGVDQSLAA